MADAQEGAITTMSGDLVICSPNRTGLPYSITFDLRVLRVPNSGV
jgi:hypothetical protein